MTAINPDKTEEKARLILQHYVGSMVADLGNSLEGILLAGSLATGSYIPGPGDIDQITILKSSASEKTEKRVIWHIRETREAFNRSINLAPIVYRRSDLKRPWCTDWDFEVDTKHLVTIPEELLRIHDHAQVMYGDPTLPTQLPKPTIEEMIAYHERWKKWGEEAQIRHPEWKPPVGEIPIRIAVQIVLSNAIWHYYFATRCTCFNKHQVAQRLRMEVPNYQFYEGVELATQLRTSGFNATNEIREKLNEWCMRFQEWKENQPANAVPLSK